MKIENVISKIKDIVLKKCSDGELYDEMIERKHKCDYGYDYYHQKHKDILIEGELTDKTNKESFNIVYKRIMERCQYYNDMERIEILKSFRRLISLDMMYSYLSEIAYNEDHYRPRLPYIPSYYLDKTGNKAELNEVFINELDIKDKILIDCPYMISKWAYHVLREDELNSNKMHSEGNAYYFPSIDMVFIGSGNYHRTAEAIVNREICIIPLYKIDDNALFDHVETDGANWISIHNNEIIGNCHDFRIALVFKLRKEELRQIANL